MGDDDGRRRPRLGRGVWPLPLPDRAPEPLPSRRVVVLLLIYGVVFFAAFGALCWWMIAALAGR